VRRERLIAQLNAHEFDRETLQGGNLLNKAYSFRNSIEALVETLSELKASPRNAEDAYLVAYLCLFDLKDFEVRRDVRVDARELLAKSAQDADGLRLLVEALRTPAPEFPKESPLESDLGWEELQREIRKLENSQQSAYYKLGQLSGEHQNALTVLRNVISGARPTSDAAANVLLEAVKSNDEKLRAAALEALSEAAGS
ncbi:MAG: hypothetical protein AAF907_08825, partial [Planctomycetota bacterium]